MKNLIHRSSAAVLLLVLVCLLSVGALAADAPTITRDLNDTLSLTVGDTIVLEVVAEGEGLSYQWYRNGSPIAGAESSQYTITAASASNNGDVYACYVQNSAGAVASRSCTVAVTARITKPTITSDISRTAVTVNVGDTISLTAAADSGGSAGMLTQWFKRQNGSALPITGETNTTLTLTVTEELAGAELYCQFTNEAGSASTSVCAVTVNGVATPSPSPTGKEPSVTKDPTSETVDEGGYAIFIARADNTKTYLWRFVSPAGNQVYDYNQLGNTFPELQISGGTTEKITISNIPVTMDGWMVECLFTGDGGTAVSARATIRVNKVSTTLSIINQPIGGTAAIDGTESITLSVQATASTAGRLAYQWYTSDSSSAATMRAVNGATSSSYTPPREEGTRYYRVAISVSGTASEPFYSNTVSVTYTAKKEHEHSYSDVWEQNDISHWHRCTCGAHADEAFHSYEWTMLREPTADADGEQNGVCRECGFETVQPIPAGSMTAATPAPDTKNTARPSGAGWLVLLGVVGVAVVAVAAFLIWRIMRANPEEELEDGDIIEGDEVEEEEEAAPGLLDKLPLFSRRKTKL